MKKILSLRVNKAPRPVWTAAKQPLLLGLVCCLPLFLTACGTTPALTLPEMETVYETFLQTTLDTFQSYASSLPENLQTTTDLTISFPQSSNLQGNITYTSTQHTMLPPARGVGSEADGGVTEKTNHLFNVFLQNLTTSTPILLSGNIDTLYIHDLIHFNIQNFNLFMGEGNVEVNFINLLAQQLANKRVALDKNEKIWLSVVETPDFSELLSQLSNFLTSTNLTSTATNTQPANEIEATIAFVNAEHLASLQSLYTLFANLFDLPLPSEDFTLDTANQNVAFYTTSSNKEVSIQRTLHYLAGNQHLQVDVTKSSHNIGIRFTTWNEEEGIDKAEHLQLNLQLSRQDQYHLSVTHSKDDTPLLEAEGEIQVTTWDNQLSLTFQGTANFQSFQLANNEQLQIDFQATQTFQPSTETDFSLSGTIINLSDIL